MDIKCTNETNLVKEEKGDMRADPNCILYWWKKNTSVIECIWD